LIDMVKRTLLIAVTITTGLVILMGYFINLPALVSVRKIFLNWAIILAAVALLIGLINLIVVHARKIINKEPGSHYSLVLLVSLMVTAVVGIVSGPTSKMSQWIFNNIQIPIETSLMALLAVVLISAAIRFTYRRPTSFSLIFIFTTLIIMLGTVSNPWLNVSWLSELRLWITRVPVVGGARGILFGVVLGTIATGLRVLMGADRPYED